jgi:hypothetical protein
MQGINKNTEEDFFQIILAYKVNLLLFLHLLKYSILVLQIRSRKDWHHFMFIAKGFQKAVKVCENQVFRIQTAH